MPLPSQLETFVDDSEEIVRYLVHRSWIKTNGVRHDAFMPNPKDGESSVFREVHRSPDLLWQTARTNLTRIFTIHGACAVRVGSVRQLQLSVESHEPPDRHAAIGGWPRLPEDPKERKNRHIDLAVALAGALTFREVLETPIPKES